MPLDRTLTWKGEKEKLSAFLDTVFAFVAEQKLDVTDLEIDHIALRLKHIDDVDRMKKEIAAFSINHAPLSSAIVNGREILMYQLSDPLKYHNRQIPCIELPYPKDPHDYPQDGWEHVEFVLESNAETMEDFEAVFRARFPHITDYRVDMPHGPADQLPNPSIVLQKYKGLAIKFHPASIEKIIRGKK